MLLFIDSDNNTSTGWEGYDFVVNYDVIDGTATTLCAYKEGVWQEIGAVSYRVRDNEFMVAIPRSLLGLTDELIAAMKSPITRCATARGRWMNL